MMRKVLFSLVLLLAVHATAAIAAEGGESNLFAGDIGNAVWTLVIFLLVILVLGKFAWGPLLGGLQQREEFIRRSLQEAKADREAAESRLQEYEEKLTSAGAEASQIVEQGKSEGEKLRAGIEERARDEADKMVDRARREIELAKQTAIRDLYATSSELATEIASRIVQRELNPQDHEKLISDSIKELGDLDQN
jgi:F-type H+-transporting ATPase subunit b